MIEKEQQIKEKTVKETSASPAENIQTFNRTVEAH